MTKGNESRLQDSFDLESKMFADSLKRKAIITANVDAWNSLRVCFEDWLKGNDRSGKSFGQFLLRLFESTKRRFGDDCIQNVVGFDSTRYEPPRNQVITPRIRDNWISGIAVEFVLKYFVAIDAGKKASAIQAMLKKDQSFVDLKDFAKSCIAAFSTDAQYVIRRGEPDVTCEICQIPLPPGRFCYDICAACDSQKIKMDGERSKKKPSIVGGEKIFEPPLSALSEVDARFPTASYRDNGLAKGKPLTAKFLKDRYRISGSQLSIKGKDHRQKFGRGFVYKWKLVSKLSKNKN